MGVPGGSGDHFGTIFCAFWGPYGVILGAFWDLICCSLLLSAALCFFLLLSAALCRSLLLSAALCCSLLLLKISHVFFIGSDSSLICTCFFFELSYALSVSPLGQVQPFLAPWKALFWTFFASFFSTFFGCLKNIFFGAFLALLWLFGFNFEQFWLDFWSRFWCFFVVFSRSHFWIDFSYFSRKNSKARTMKK